MSRLRNRISTSGAAPTFMSTMDPSPIALIGSSANGDITSWNRAATKLLGSLAIDVVGRKLSDVLGCEGLATPRPGSDLTRVRAQVTAARGTRLEVELFVDNDVYRYLTSGEYMVAVVPVTPSSMSSDRACPPIDSWVDAGRVIREVGSYVQCVALGLVGVDAVNRGYSRSTGDAVLREVGSRLERSVGSRGRVVRVAGNQFVVVAPDDDGLDAANLVAIVSQPVDTPLGRIRIGCYAGSTCGDSASGLVVLGRADSAMQRAAALGVGAIATSSNASPQVRPPDGPNQPRLSVLLMDAVARRDIGVSFRPVVELTSGHIIGFEALARWNSGELGEVDPTLFIEAAEDAGLIHELGQIVLTRSLDVVQAEVLAGRWGGRRLSVNLSAVQLAHPDLPERIAEALSTRRLPGAVLQLELTGTRVLLDIESAAERLAKLREIGVRLSIDGFGTGFANLDRLRDLPIDAIKIDGRFVADICTSVPDTAVIRSMLALAGELRLDAVVAGVETSAQHLALARLGCVAVQGTLYSGDRAAADLYQSIALPDRSRSDGYPYPHDEAGRLEALHATDVLDTPAEDVYNEIVRAAADLCGTPISLVSLIDENRQWFKAKIGIDVDETARDVAFCAHTICSETLMEIPDTHDDRRFAANPFVVDEPQLRFYAGVPLRSTAGHSYGTLCVLDTVPRLLTPEQRDGLARLARQVTVLLELRGSINQLSHAYAALELAHQERDEVEANLRYQAHYDPLTGLPNRSLLMERIEIAFAESAATGQPLAMLICDLDDFKLVNDGLGHPAGDQLLVEVAHRLRSSVRERDTVARFGGDEFVVVINNADHHTVSTLCARILDDMRASVSIGGRDDLIPSISIGVAALTPGVNADQLLSNADAAMYRAKALGGGRMCEFDEALGVETLDRLTMTTEFRSAVTNDELFCVHQPEIDLVNGHLFGLETLVRWRHPTRGVLMPDQFVPMLEATNGTDALFERVLHLTLEAQAEWAAQLGQWPSVAVNLSARQLHDSALVGTVLLALEKFSAPADSLWLEVTETALASAPTFDTLHEIHGIGVHLAIDDFGVGWSSMARLSLFPWDLLKIDRTFIAQLGQTDSAEQVIRGIISLAHSLRIRISAEGVETNEQLRLLRESGCDIVQGYLIDRPLPADQALQRMTIRSSLGQSDVIDWNESSADPQRVQQLFLGMNPDEPVHLRQMVPHG